MMLTLILYIPHNPIEITRSKTDDTVTGLPFEDLSTAAVDLVYFVRASTF
jgi:hypothetical protein